MTGAYGGRTPNIADDIADGIINELRHALEVEESEVSDLVDANSDGGSAYVIACGVQMFIERNIAISSHLLELLTQLAREDLDHELVEDCNTLKERRNTLAD